jgi:hypothetical protein
VPGAQRGTGKTHIKGILPKLDAADGTHAVMTALKRGILDLWYAAHLLQAKVVVADKSMLDTQTALASFHLNVKSDAATLR